MINLTSDNLTPGKSIIDDAVTTSTIRKIRFKVTPHIRVAVNHNIFGTILRFYTNNREEDTLSHHIYAHAANQ